MRLTPSSPAASAPMAYGFIDCLKILRYPGLAEILGRQLGRRLKREGIGKVDWVISSPYAAITFGHEVAKELGTIFSSAKRIQQILQAKKCFGAECRFLPARKFCRWKN